MAKAHSSRGRRVRREPINSSKRKPAAQPSTMADEEPPGLYELLGHFSHALAIVETAFTALDAAQERCAPISPGVLTLQRGIDELKRVYTGLDLASLRLE